MHFRRRHFVPPFCPNPDCFFHGAATGWNRKRAGFYLRKSRPYRIQRFQCLHCLRWFSTQTFSTTYWLKRRDLLPILFHRILACSALRQIARELNVAPSTVQRQIERLGRHCLLYQHLHRPKTVSERLVIDGFESFEFSQYHPCHFNLAAGANSHYFYAFTDAELRRKGRMTPAQKARRAFLERSFGRPDPAAIRKEVTNLLEIILPDGGDIAIDSDDHPAYPPAFRNARGITVTDHRVTPSRRPRTASNPLFPVNLLDLLVRHSSSNHKRETIAFPKRRQNAAERLSIVQVWRNHMKPVSEKDPHGPCPAEILGLRSGKLSVRELLAERLFPSLVRLPKRLEAYYRREIQTRRIPNGRRHNLKYAF
jgi:transposase-like protein